MGFSVRDLHLGDSYPWFLPDGRHFLYNAVGSRSGANDPRAPLRTTRQRLGRLDAYPYAVSRDARRFLFNTFVEEATSTGLTMVINWPAGMK